MKSFDEERSDVYENVSNIKLKKINMTGLIKDVDCIINIPKLKAHQLTRYSGAIKNIFGCIPGGLKPQCHALAPNPKEFAGLLADVYMFVKPKIILNVMDGIVGLEGNGPGPSGTIKRSDIIAVSKDALSLDIVCSSLIGARPKDIPMLKECIDRGMQKKRIETNEKVNISPYLLPKPFPIPSSVYKYFAKFSYYKPTVDNEKCKRCGMCVNICPQKALTIKDKLTFDYSKCIYCYCCHENCPFCAIKLKDNIFLRLHKRFAK